MFHKTLLTVGLMAGVFAGAAFAQEANQSTTEGLEQMVNVTIEDQAVLDAVLEGQGEYGPDLALPVTVPTDVGTAAAVCGTDEAALAASSQSGEPSCTLSDAAHATPEFKELAYQAIVVGGD